MADLMIFSNDASGFLQTGVDASSTTLTLQAGQGAKFPMYSVGQYSICVMEIESSYEVIKIVSRSGDVLQIQRAQEGTSAAPFPAGTLVEMRVTSGVLTYLRQLAMSSQSESTPYKSPVRVVATTNVALSGLQTIAGVLLTSGERVLLTGQTNLAENGVYVVQTGVWFRATDFNTWAKTVSAIVPVTDGIPKADSVWMCTNSPGSSFLLDSSPTRFIQIAGEIATTAYLPLAGGDLLGDLGLLSSREKITALGNTTGSVTLDASLGNVFTATSTAATTWTFSGRPSAGQCRYLELRLVNGGAFTQTFPTGTVFSGGDKTLTAAGTDKLIIMLTTTGADVSIVKGLA